MGRSGRSKMIYCMRNKYLFLIKVLKIQKLEINEEIEKEELNRVKME